MIHLSPRERQFIQSRDVCGLSTIGRNGWPHTVPTGYVFFRGAFFIPSNQKAKKVRNLEGNDKATVLVDDERKEHGVMLECRSKLIRGKKAEPLREYMRKVKHWQNDERTILIQLTPIRKASWFRE